jgi:hypothetical protein
MSDGGPVERAVVTKRRIYRLAPEQESEPVEGGMFLARGRGEHVRGNGWTFLADRRSSLRCRGLPGHRVIISHS